MSEPLIDRLSKHVAIFEKITERNLASHYEEVQERGKQAFDLAADLREAMESLLLAHARMDH